MIDFARLFVIIGVIFVIIGGLIYLFARVNFPIGNLPGDIYLKWGNMSCFIGLGTSIFLSILLTIILNILARFLNK